MSETFLDRLVIERDDLETKCDQLNQFLESESLDLLDNPHQNLLKTQHAIMTAYLGILNIRLNYLTKTGV